MKASLTKDCAAFVFAACALAFTAAPASAQSEATASAPASSSTSVITGRVLNAGTRNYLGNAQVRDIASGAAVYTNSDGFFSLAVPAGTRTISVSYTGLDTVERQVSVQPGSNVLGEISLTRRDYEEIIRLDDFVVATEREGRAASLTQQRRAENTVSVVSSDEFPNVTSGSIGDFLQNLPGIAIDYSGVDPRSVRVRGMDPNMGSVTVDGMRAANAASSSTNRVFEIDQISLQNIESIEVTKAPTAAQEADQGGGNVNLVSKSAFKQKGRRISYGLSMNANSQNLTSSKSPYPDVIGGRVIRPGGTFDYSEAFNERLGVSFNVNWYEFVVLGQSTQTNFNPASNFTTYNATTNPNPRTIEDPDGAYIGEHVYSVSPVLTSRQSVGVNFDYRLSDNTTLWAKGQVSASLITAAGRGLSLNAPNPRLVTAATNDTRSNFDDTHQEVIGDNPATHNPVTSTSGSFARAFAGDVLKKKGAGTVFSLGADQRFGDWIINYAGSVSQSSNHYQLDDEDVGGATFYLRGIGFNLDTERTSPYTKITQTAGPDIFDLSNYVSRNQTGTGTPQGTFVVGKTRESNGKDKFYNAKVDVRRNFTIPYVSYVKAGSSFRQQERKTDRNGRRRWAYVGPDGVPYTADDTAIDYGQFQDDPPEQFPGGYPTPPVPSMEKVSAYFNSHRNEFLEDIVYNIGEEALGRQSITEKVYGGYAMASSQFGQFGLLTGVRFERTEDKGTGVVTLPVDNSIADLAARTRARYRGLSASNAYNNWYPNVQGKYTLFGDLVARASYTKSIGRQNFGNIIPGYSVVTPSGSNPGRVESTNIELKPVYFENYELSLEYYLKPVGIVSAGLFYKDISNYTRNIDTDITEGDTSLPEYVRDAQYIGYIWRRRVNVGDAKVKGFELNYSQQLSYYSDLLEGVSVFANYTELTSEGNSTYGGTAVVANEKAPLENFVPITYNMGVSYTGHGLRLSLKYNYKGQYLENLNDRRWYSSRGVFDFYASYEFYKRHAFFVDVKNIGNQVSRKWEGVEYRTRQYNIDGAIINVGFKGSF